VTEVHEVREKTRVMEKTIRLESLYYSRQENIALCCQDDVALHSIIKKILGAKWCHTKKCWYVPLNKESYETVCGKLKFEANIDTTELKNYLEKKKQVVSTNGAGSPIGPVWQLSAENLAALKRFVEQLKLKAYSSYRNSRWEKL
jgi:integrase/recombinase XerD